MLDRVRSCQMGRHAESPERSHELVRRAAVLIGLWLLTLALTTAALAARTAAPIEHVVFDVASALSNVGLSTEVVGPDLDGTSKVVLAVVMYLGRLELLATLILATRGERA